MDPAVEHARLLAAGEKHLQREEAARAKEAARVEAELAKRQAARLRSEEARKREDAQAEKEAQRQARQAETARLKALAEAGTAECNLRREELETVLLLRPEGLELWHPHVEQAFIHEGPQGVAEMVEDLLQRSPVPPGCRTASRAVYTPEAQQLLIDVELPNHEIVPAVASYRYVAQRAEVVPLPVKQAEVNDAYARLVARLALRALDEAFSATPAAFVETVILNGRVNATDPTTGQAVRACVVSVVAQRKDFAELVLDEPRLDPQQCLHRLGATVSKHPHDLEPVTPIVEADLSRYRITTDTAVVATLDSRPDLLQMNPYDFERLVRELFEAMGYETWRTQGSRDDGVDAVATLADPTGSTIFAIQAKRSKNVVPVNTVRAMSGVMQDKDAGYGIVVTTSWFGKDSYDFAHRNGRIRLIDGRNLKALLTEHLNIDALIGLPKVPPGWQAGDLV
ncbi:restriction endonuclease [Kitasatospora purpeofusca]|uniref:restriction endonuclease n=1 Tax=Kitasatospora purpeofusca TaxID=67352 RepID=UPI002E123338|nr:restriction endonuclease [Kitasatospora purpeofusca]WSR43233.1 restriction endonuclease [Kitasatospora purpeofusca]